MLSLKNVLFFNSFIIQRLVIFKVIKIISSTVFGILNTYLFTLYCFQSGRSTDQVIKPVNVGGLIKNGLGRYLRMFYKTWQWLHPCLPNLDMTRMPIHLNSWENLIPNPWKHQKGKWELQSELRKLGMESWVWESFSFYFLLFLWSENCFKLEKLYCKMLHRQKSSTAF